MQFPTHVRLSFGCNNTISCFSQHVSGRKILVEYFLDCFLLYLFQYKFIRIQHIYLCCIFYLVRLQQCIIFLLISYAVILLRSKQFFIGLAVKWSYKKYFVFYLSIFLYIRQLFEWCMKKDFFNQYSLLVRSIYVIKCFSIYVSLKSDYSIK